MRVSSICVTLLFATLLEAHAATFADHSEGTGAANALAANVTDDVGAFGSTPADATGNRLAADPPRAATSVFDPDPAQRVLGVHTLGHYDDAGLGTWNGQPLSDTNRPSEFEDQLESDWDFFVDPASPNAVFVRVTNVYDTHYGYISGAPFEYVALAGFSFELPTRSAIPLVLPTFSNGYAIPGEELNGFINGNTTETMPLNETPGWAFSENQPGHYRLATPTVGYAFSHFGNIYGTTRIRVGGLFHLEWPGGTDLRQEVRWGDVVATADHGLGRYQAAGEVTFVLAATTTTATMTTTTATTTTLPPPCAPTPTTGCRLTQPGGSSVQLKDDANNTRDQLVWSWGKGSETLVDAFADPVRGSAVHHLCVYDASGRGQPLMEMDVSSGGTCEKKPCWRASGRSGFAYDDKAGARDGITRLKLRAGAASKASVQAAGKGAALPMPALGLTLPVTVQLVIRDGTTTECWQTTFTAASRNNAMQFRSKGP